MHVLEEHFWVCLHIPSDDGSSRSRPNRLCWPFRLHGPITEKTTIPNLNIIHFSYTVSLCYKKLTHVRQYTTLLFYIMPWFEQKCVAGNIMKNSRIYCLMSVCSSVIILKVYIFFSSVMDKGVMGWGWLWYGGRLIYRCVLHSLKDYHQKTKWSVNTRDPLQYRIACSNLFGFHATLPTD